MMRHVIALLLLAACTPVPYERPLPPPPPILDGGTPCERACARAEQLECPEAEPEAGEDGTLGTDDDIACVTWMCAADYLKHDELAQASSCEAFR
jgi:hypothetical protein